MNSVDFIVLGVLGFYFWRGWAKGLFRSLLGPVALVVCFVYSYIYFQRTNNFVVSLVICVLGPIFLNIIFIGLFAILKKAKKKTDEKDPDELRNRLFGGLINVLWIGFLLFLSLSFFAMIPIKVPGLENARKAVVESKSISFISGVMGDRMAFLRKDTEPIDVEVDQSYLPKLQKTSEYAQLMGDERVKVLFEDSKTLEMIQNKDVMGLMSDPKVLEIMQDPELIQKFLKLNQKMVQINQSQEEVKGHGDDIHENY